MKASTKRALSLFLAVALITAAFVIYASLIRPEYVTIKELRGLLSSKTSLYSQEQIAITQVQNLIAQYQGVARLSDQLSLALPNEESVSSIMAQLNAIAQSNGISIQGVGIAYLPIKKSSSVLSSAHDIGTLRLNLKLSGNYNSFKLFLGDMERNVRVMDAKLLEINQAGDPNQDIFTYIVNVDTYYQVSK